LSGPPDYESSERTRKDLFLDQAEGYVKALEKSTYQVLSCREVFEHFAQERLDSLEESERNFEGSVCCTKWWAV
jgi:hypothetical protein